MGLSSLFYILDTVAVGGLTGAAFYMIGTEPHDFRVARRCFVGAGAALGSVAWVWDMTATQSILVRLVVIALIGAVTAAATSEALRYVARREKWVAEKAVPRPKGGLTQRAYATVTPPPANAPPRTALDAPSAPVRADLPAPATPPILFVQCVEQRPPERVPASGIYWMIQLQRLSGLDSGFGVAQISGIPGHESGWPNDLFPSYRCDITNYTNRDIANATIYVTASHWEAIKNSNGSWQSGKFLGQQTHEARITLIDASKDKPWSLYIINMSGEFIELRIEDHAVVRFVGEDKDAHAPLDQPKPIMAMHFMPHVSTP